MKPLKHVFFHYPILISLLTYAVGSIADAGFRPLRDGQFAMIVSENGQCLEIDPRGNERNGARIQLGRCDGSPRQLWTYDEFVGAIRNRNGKCIDADANGRNRNGTRVQLWDCNSSLNQDWVHRVFRERDSIRGAGGKCLDAMRESFGRDGNPLQLWDCHGGENQRFWGQVNYRGGYPGRPGYGNPSRGDQNSPGYGWNNPDTPNRPRPPTQATRGQLINGEGKCLTVENHRDMDKKGTSVWGTACNQGQRRGGKLQFWRYEPNGSLVNPAGLCLDVDGPQINRNGGKVQLWECNGSPNQQWQFDDRGRLVNAGGRCLDMDSNTRNNPYTKVHIWDCHKSENQRWTLEAPDFRR